MVSGNTTNIMRRTLFSLAVLELIVGTTQAADVKNTGQIIASAPSSQERMAEETRSKKQRPVPSSDVMEANGARIGSIKIIVKDIFDLNNPKENTALFRTVDHLHIKTRQNTIANLLLFKSGDKFVGQELTDSERLLRNMGFLYDARVRVVKYEQNKADVEVITTDVWTLNLSISFSHKGGESQNSYELRDTNFLGYGRSLRVKRASDVDRVERTLEYYDPNLGGHHNELTVAFSDNSDGLVKHFNLNRPFLSLDTRWSFTLNSEYIEQTEKIYAQGEVAHSFDHKKRYYDFLLGYSKGLINDETRRWSFGFNAHADDFQANDLSSPNYKIPDNRALNYPWIKYEYVQNRYIKTRRLNYINRTEDLNLGRYYNILLGWSDKSLNATSNSLIYEGNYNTSYKPDPIRLYLISFGVGGRLTQGRSDELHLSSNTRYYFPYLPDRAFYSALSFEISRNTSGETQLLLGGDNGLRGYPIRFQQGDRKVLYTMEQRFYTNWHLWQLIYVGGAMFFDIGRAWSGDTPKTPLTGFMRDVGLGLRLTSSRAGKGQVLHMDIAFPLNANNISTIDKAQYIVGTEATF